MIARPARSPRRRQLFPLTFVESLETRTLLSSGLMITAITPTEVENATFDHVDLTFNEAIAPSSFTTDDVTLVGPPGTSAITATGVTELSTTTYRVSFDALTVRGTYHITIGPDVTDQSGNEMDQNQNGVPGETPGDQYVASLEYINATTIFTTNTIIHEGDTTYDGQDIAVDGATVTIDGPHDFDSVQLVHGAALTHSADTATQTHELDLTVTEQVIVDASSKIDVTGKGYLPGYTTGNTTVGGATGVSGGSYGGLGVSSRGATNPVYGDYANPDDWGAGGANFSGGGLVRIAAATLQLDGQLLANGLDDTSGGDGSGDGDGAGGGIYVSVMTLSGGGPILAMGGHYGAAGGGRIAVYTADSSSFSANASARGGWIYGEAGAGTVYLRDTNDATGTLIIDNGSGGYPTTVTPLGLPSQTTMAIPDAVVVRGSQTRVVNQHAGLVLEFQNSLTVQQSATLSVEAAGFVSDAAPAIQTGATLNVSGDYAPTTPPTVTGANLNVSGDLTLAVPLQLTNASVTVAGVLTSTVPQTITGGTITTDQVVAPAWSLVQGAVLTSFASTTTQMHKLEIQVDGTLSVDATSRIDVTGKGYLPGYTTGNTTTGGATGQSGGSYGGLGVSSNGATNPVYGDYANPDDWAPAAPISAAAAWCGSRRPPCNSTANCWPMGSTVPPVATAMAMATEPAAGSTSRSRLSAAAGPFSPWEGITAPPAVAASLSTLPIAPASPPMPPLGEGGYTGRPVPELSTCATRTTQPAR